MDQQEKVVYTPCQGWMCHEWCVLTTHVKNGRITRTERTVFPGLAEDVTGICQKGIEAGKLPFIENRVLYPMKRIGERGEGKFERISWDQAMDEIGAKLNQISAEHGSESVLLYNYCCGVANVFGSLNYLLSGRFIHTYGATLFPWPPVDLDVLHAFQVGMGSWIQYVNPDLRQFRRSKYILIWGGNPIGFTRAARTTRYLLEAKENGAKLVDIGVLFDSTAAKADQFVPVKPGTDTTLALAIANVMLRDNLWDSEFMRDRTVAPFLVRDDNGRFLRESDIRSGGDPHNYVYWDQIQQKPGIVPPHGIISNKAAPDLFAEPTIEGISCKTAMVHIRNFVAPWTPEAQQEITGVPASVAEQIAHEYVKTENSMIYQYFGMRYINGGFAGRAILLVAALSGKMDDDVCGYVVEGMAGEDPSVSLNGGAILFPGNPAEAKGSAPCALSPMLQAGFPYKALINVLGNPIQNWPNRELWVKQIYPKLDLIVDYEYRLSDTARFADYVLPDTTPFEREELCVPRFGHAILLEKAIDPIGEAKPPADFYYELAKRIGLEQYFNKTTEEWNELLLQTNDPAIANLNPPLTMERLRNEKMVKLDVSLEERHVYGDFNFPNESGRIELYAENFADVGSPVGKVMEPVIHGPDKERYPLQLMVFRHRLFMQTQFSELPDLAEIAGKRPWVDINPLDAETRGIAHGDLVEVFNNRGSFKCKAKFSNALPPGSVKVLFTYPASAWEGDPPQALMTPSGTPELDDPVITRLAHLMKSKSAFPTVDLDAQCGTGWETLWDNLCEIRKVEEVAK